MKLRALALLREGWDMDMIVEALEVSERSIQRWEGNFEDYGCVNPKSVLQGCPHTLNATVMEELDDLI
jgi:transposase